MEDRLYDGDPSRAARTRRTLERVRGRPEDILESRRTKKDFEIGREDIWRTMSLALALALRVSLRDNTAGDLKDASPKGQRILGDSSPCPKGFTNDPEGHLFHTKRPKGW